MDKSWVGKIGEDTVAQYLTGKKYKIIDRNFRTTFGELDLVATDHNGTLIFVEVKTLIMPDSDSLSPEDNFSAGKLKKFQRVAAYYASLNPEMVNEKYGFRLDVVTLACPSADALANPEKLCKINHYENIA